MFRWRVPDLSGGNQKISAGIRHTCWEIYRPIIMCAWLSGVVVRVLDLRLEIAGSIPAASLSSVTQGKLFICLCLSFGTVRVWVNRHTVRHTGPCPWSCSFGWCLARGHGESEISTALSRTKLGQDFLTCRLFMYFVRFGVSFAYYLCEAAHRIRSCFKLLLFVHKTVSQLSLPSLRVSR